jgi:hypothetical protein
MSQERVSTHLLRIDRPNKFDSQKIHLTYLNSFSSMFRFIYYLDNKRKTRTVESFESLHSIKIN